MPRKIIQHSDGREYSVTHADFLAIYQGLGFTEVRDEPDHVADVAPATYPAVDDAGAWDDGPFYVIAHSDGRQYAVTYENYINRYAGLGFTIVAGENGAAIPSPALLTEFGDTFITEAGDRLLLEAA